MSGAEYTSILVSLLGLMAIVVATLFWRMFTRMERKIDDWFIEHMQCRERQQKEFVKVGDFKEWQKGRDNLWKRLNRHGHDPKTGQVVITEE